jgi:hypothetical protein
MVASIAACRLAYEDKGDLFVEVRSKKMQNVAFPEDGAEDALVEDQPEAWIEQAGASATKVVDVMTDIGLGPVKVGACVRDSNFPDSVLAEFFGSVESVVDEVEAAGMLAHVPGSCLVDEVVEASVLAPNSKVLGAKELCDLLVSLEAACLGYGKEIACVLTGDASEGIIRKVEKYLRRTRKIRGVRRKAFVAA